VATDTSGLGVGEAASPPGGDGTVAKTDLNAGAMGLPALLMHSITNVSPTIAIISGFVFVGGSVGAQVPLVFAAAGLIVFMTAVPLTQLAKAIPSAGGYYTYIAKTISARAGWLAAWLFVLWEPPCMAVNLAYLGALLENEFKSNYGFTWPWWATVLVGAAIVFIPLYRGVKVSAKALFLFGGIEFVIIMALSIWGFFEPGKGGVSLAPFDPTAVASFNTFFLAVIFSLFTFAGWEGAPPMAEESRNPRRNVVLATIGAVLFLSALFIVASWGLATGWGIEVMPGIAKTTEAAPLVLAHRYWGGAWVIILFAMVNSSLAISIAAGNVSTRMWYAMSRSGALPKAIGYIHPKTKVPLNAMHVQVVATLFFGPICGWIIGGPEQLFFFWGFATAFVLAAVFTLGNIGVMRLYLGDLRHEFKVIPHFIFPILSTAALIWLVYKFINPWPEPPNDLALPLVIAWFTLGCGILYVMKRRGHDRWMELAGEAIEEVSEHPAGPAAHFDDIPVD
jgi:amino acid transporter